MAQPSGFKEVLAQTGLMTQEALVWTKQNAKSLFIGLPREVSMQEHRISLTPDAVGLLIRNGHRVVIETGAGNGAKFTDSQYSEAGAQVVYSTEELYKADVIVKVQPLTDLEIEYLQHGATVVSSLNMSKLTKEYFEKLNRKKITGLCYEYIEDNAGGIPIIRAMSEIAGSTVMLIAAEYLSSGNDGMGVILGGITGVPPTKVVILGAGTVSEYAARIAIGLGADLKVFDKDIFKLQRLKYSVGQNIYTCIIDSNVLTQAIRDADVVIGALRAEDGFTPCIVTEEMVSMMKPNSVIIDVCIDSGGCFETSEITTHDQPIFRKYDVIHYCVPNIPSRVAHTASQALSNIFTSFLLKTGKTGGIEEAIFANKAFMKGVYSFKGSLTNATVAKKFGLNYKDLSLLSAARF
ncbi:MULTISPECIES: alanine dehydrogenase [Arcicella]|uniref:alanine dehydrogenase n=1 Tax=Arcicella aquatica TaxID=217141 RepID=A0ABU5QIJ4_9BACT|nr:MULTISPECIES: alanine dehydrogenase [Arcicella]MDR6560858.1 alanine dehydrogenase [Arcicella sp. BE51]MDR6810742.1 alanine dehydrogenase [Arcicella sp. BE140]MDR6822092.1 alanine dehydrogenase [Arcicella sp. BE139]MEA5256311.1 alanine dehydrogenase [Arcicella aquatica]